MHERIEFRDVLAAVKRLLLLNGIILLVMSLFRTAFFFYFSRPGELAGLGRYVAEAFVLGARFDLSAVAYVNTLVTLTLLLLWAFGRRNHFAAWAKSLVWYYWATFGIVFFLLVVDFGFYSYFKDHINVTIYGFFEDDTMALVKTIAQNHRFPAALALLVAFMAGLWYLCRSFTRSLDTPATQAGKEFSVTSKTAFAVLLVAANFLAARGTLRMFPLSPIYAEISPNAFINKLSVNGVFALGEAMKARKENGTGDFNLARKMGYDGKARAAFAAYLGVPEASLPADPLEALRHRTPKNAFLESSRPNVVVVVMESFGGNLLRYDQKEFDLLGEFRRHYESGDVFPHFLPGGIITIHALETIILNVCQRPFNLSVTQTRYAYQPFPSAAPLPYKRAGYRTAFVYGGSLRWRQLDTFLPSQGFDELVGESSLAAGRESNEWGAYDEYLFDAAYNKLETEPGKPKFIMIMTTTNHPPYSVPSSYKPGPLHIPPELAKVMTTDKTLALQRFRTYQYANQKLGEFITKIKNSPQGANTIIAVTGDHNFWDIFNYGTGDQFYRYSVPFYLSIPAAYRPRSIDTSVYGSHVDIMPTLYHLSLSDAEYLSMGRDLLNPGARQVANSEGLVVSPQGAALCRTDGGKSAWYRWADQMSMTAADDAAALAAGESFYRAALTVAEYVIKHASDPRAGGDLLTVKSTDR